MRRGLFDLRQSKQPTPLLRRGRNREAALCRLARGNTIVRFSRAQSSGPGDFGAGGSGSRRKSTRSTLPSRAVMYRSILMAYSFKGEPSLGHHQIDRVCDVSRVGGEIHRQVLIDRSCPRLIKSFGIGSRGLRAFEYGLKRFYARWQRESPSSVCITRRTALLLGHFPDNEEPGARGCRASSLAAEMPRPRWASGIDRLP
jgi:hypothetical protein